MTQKKIIKYRSSPVYTGLATLFLHPLALLDFHQPNGVHGHDEKHFPSTSLIHDHLGREYWKSGPFGKFQEEYCITAGFLYGRSLQPWMYISVIWGLYCQKKKNRMPVRFKFQKDRKNFLL